MNDDLTLIDEVIKKRNPQVSKKIKKRIINLYHGYQYILTHQKIDKESLRELYSILSEDILESYDQIHMGKYYRTKPVYILRGNYLSKECYMGIEANQLDFYMDAFFDFINHDKTEQTEISSFIKSQIMHFYFVYIHPYFDVNGRTSRTVSMWYLLNEKAYPYIIFNRAIAFSKKEYEKSIIKSRRYGNMTFFLKYMLEQVKIELEKEYVIQNIKSISSSPITKEESQMLEYFLSMNGNLTLKDLAYIYNQYNEHKNINRVIEEKIQSLIDKKILVVQGYTKSLLNEGKPNAWISMNQNYLEIDREKVKHLSLFN